MINQWYLIDYLQAKSMRELTMSLNLTFETDAQGKGCEATWHCVPSRGT